MHLLHPPPTSPAPPTCPQLLHPHTRFFSPEVLAQANSGTLPAMPPLPTQKVLHLPLPFYHLTPDPPDS